MDTFSSSENPMGKVPGILLDELRSHAPLRLALYHAIHDSEDDEEVQRPVMEEIRKQYEWFGGSQRLAYPAIQQIYDQMQAMFEVTAHTKRHHRYVRTARIYREMMLFLVFATEQSTEMDMECSDLMEIITKDILSWDARDMPDSETLIMREIFDPLLLAKLDDYNMAGGLATAIFMT